jgi:hypothetical protein
LLLGTGQSYRDRIKRHSHCNPTTKVRLLDILQRAGFSIKYIESDNIVNYKSYIMNRFKKQPIAHRCLYGVAYASSYKNSTTAKNHQGE